MSATQALKAAVTGQQQPEGRTAYETLKRQLENQKHEFRPLLGTSQAVDEFIRVTLNAVMANPDLLQADRRSLILACMKAAEDKLMPDSHESVLNVYSVKVKDDRGRESWVQQVQYLPMVHGVVKNLYASGEVLTLDAAVVFSKEVEQGRFRFVRGDNPRLEHEPTLDDDPGDIVAAYCVVKLRNGEFKREVMPWRDIERVRAMSKAGSGASAPWVKWLDQQCIKSVIHRIKKQLPKMPSVDRVLDHDNEAAGPADITAQASRATPVLTHQPAEVFDFGAASVGGQREAVHVEEHADSQTASQQQRTESPPFDAEAFARRLQACASVDALDVMADDIRGVADAGARAHLNAVYERRAAELRDGAAQQARTPVRGRAEPAQAVAADPFKA